MCGTNGNGQPIMTDAQKFDRRCKQRKAYKRAIEILKAEYGELDRSGSCAVEIVLRKAAIKSSIVRYEQDIEDINY